MVIDSSPAVWRALYGISRTSCIRCRRTGTAVLDQENTPQVYGANTMPKERNTKKEEKKKPSMTPKEKKAAKRAKKDSK
jgi:hypothetical protein